MKLQIERTHIKALIQAFPHLAFVAQPGLNAIGVILPLPGTEYFPGGTPEGDNAHCVVTW